MFGGVTAPPNGDARNGDACHPTKESVRLALHFFGTTFSLQQRTDFVEEVTHLVEIEVDAGEADVRDFIELLKMFEDELPETQRLDLLADALSKHLILDFPNELLDLLVADRPLGTGDRHAASQLLPQVRFPSPVSFDDLEREVPYPLVRRVSHLAIDALPAATDGHPVFADARVDDAVVVLLTKRAAH